MAAKSDGKTGNEHRTVMGLTSCQVSNSVPCCKIMGSLGGNLVCEHPAWQLRVAFSMPMLSDALYGHFHSLQAASEV